MLFSMRNKPRKLCWSLKDYFSRENFKNFCRYCKVVYTKLQILQGYIGHTFKHFATKLRNFTGILYIVWLLQKKKLDQDVSQTLYLDDKFNPHSDQSSRCLST